jgi:Asp-tRNA(Asn)/Glu-tRNA(Gln) amidotransferase A subunit family amidase
MKENLGILISFRLSPSMLFLLFVLWIAPGFGQSQGFDVMEATIEGIHDAYSSGSLTSRQLVQMYLDRIEAYDQKGPQINSIITINPKALEDAGRLDAAFRSSGLVGPLHGIPVILKDQIDTQGMPTTLGSVLMKDYFPDKDAFAVEKLKEAGAIILAKATLGEWGGGDTHGSLFGSTRNPYDLDRTVGGSSGGPGGAITANFGTVALGQEGFASIRRPSTWNSLVGMRPTAGLVSRSGVFGGWPQINGSLGPMARTIADLARLLDVLVGYDSEDPITARGVGQVPESYTGFLDQEGLKGARIGVLRDVLSSNSKPEAKDFQEVTAVFERAIGELKAAGATIIDPVVIPDLKELLATRASGPDVDPSYQLYFGRSANPPFRTRQDTMAWPTFDELLPRVQRRLSGSFGSPESEKRHYHYLMARDQLMVNLLQVMADHKLDAIVHKSIEHLPTLIKDGVNPPYLSSTGAPHLNTFLVFVPTITVPAGFSSDNLPVGISFLGRPYNEGMMIKLAYSYEQATTHRRPPKTTPPLK